MKKFIGIEIVFYVIMFFILTGLVIKHNYGTILLFIFAVLVMVENIIWANN